MKEIKLTIDGKEVPLTEEQWSFLRTIEKEKHPFERAYYGGNYFCISSLGSIESYRDCQDREAEAFFKEVNYFSTRPFARQVALRQLLYRKLLKYSYDNECEDKEWNGTNVHVYIIYNSTKKDYDTRWTRNEKEPGTVYFKSTIWATAALNEVVMPFVREHPDFVW